MKIITCIKQVPGTNKVNLDKDGNLIRDGVSSKMNPYDLYALESALLLKEKKGGSITAITMGPPQGEKVLKEAYMMGVDEAILLTDRKFAGADVLATSYALSQCINTIKNFDLIVCGLMTTDGDTAQVGPAIAEHLNLPHVAGVTKIVEVKEKSIIVEYDSATRDFQVEVKLPALLTVAKGINVPRLPSYKLKKSTKDREIKWLTVNDMEDKTTKKYGLNGSPTQVKRVFEPSNDFDKEELLGTPQELAQQLHKKLKDLKYL